MFHFIIVKQDLEKKQEKKCYDTFACQVNKEPIVLVRFSFSIWPAQLTPVHFPNSSQRNFVLLNSFHLFKHTSSPVSRRFMYHTLSRSLCNTATINLTSIEFSSSLFLRQLKSATLPMSMTFFSYIFNIISYKISSNIICFLIHAKSSYLG